MLRENYEVMYTPDPEVVAGIVAAVSRLVEDHNLRRRLGHAARECVRDEYNLESWNNGLKAALDRASGVSTARITMPAATGPREACEAVAVGRNG